MFLITQQQILSSSNPWHILCDFDGTISQDDTTDLLLETFALEGWKEIEERWEQGEIGSKQCMQEQIALLNMSRNELYNCLDTLKIDQGFLDLVEFTAHHKIPLTIVSDGLDIVIHYVLSKYKIDHLPVVANRLVQIGEKNWQLNFPNTNPRCISASGTCKCKVSQQHQQEQIILIGDGRSDFCLSEIADYVFAKDSLAEHCRSNRIQHTSFHQLSEVRNRLDDLFQSNFAIDNSIMVAV